MPIMPPILQGCTGFLYRTESDAREDQDFLAFAFFMRVPSNTQDGGYDYLITNEHVVRDVSSIVVRINTTSGFRTYGLRKSDFEVSKSFDIAAASISLTHDDLDFTVVTPRDSIEDWRNDTTQPLIGAGDEVVMVSRIDREKVRYKTKNIPALRFGCVSVTPKHEEKLFITEMRSVAGHSGSPVFVYSTGLEWHGIRNKPLSGLKLLGVNRGHLSHYEFVVPYKDVKRGKVDTSKATECVSTNMSLAHIAPAWEVVNLLNRPRFSKVRQGADKRLATVIED